jgi:hypothetical protein
VCALSHLILTRFYTGRDFHTHFINEEKEAKEGKDMLKVTQPVCSGPTFKPGLWDPRI